MQRSFNDLIERIIRRKARLCEDCHENRATYTRPNGRVAGDNQHELCQECFDKRSTKVEKETKKILLIYKNQKKE
jgi:hypothetical protein